MKEFKEFLSEAELKTRIDKVSGGRFLVMKWNTGRRGWYQDGKPFKTEKEAKDREKILKALVAAYDRIQKAWRKAHDRVPHLKTPSNEYPAKIFQATKDEMNKEFKREFPKGPFTDKQLHKSLFGTFSTAMDSWDYLSSIIAKKWK